MNYEDSSQTNGSCSINKLKDEHDLDLDLGPNSDDKGTVIMSVENVDVSLIDDSGSNSLDPNNHLSSSEHVDDNVLGNGSKEIEVEKSHGRLQSSSPPNEESSPNSSVAKGKGLKKWRRIKRDVSKEEATNSMDPIKMLKRECPNADNAKQQRSDGSFSSTNATVQTPGDLDGFGPSGSSSSYILPVSTTFSAGVDSDNSEDRSSKSSTAASAPKHQREKHRVKNAGVRNMGMEGSRSQASKFPSVSDPSKKARGGSVNMENENSLSSMESDSRSYNSVFVRGKNCVTRDQTESGRPINDDDVDDDDEPVSEEHSLEEVKDDCDNGESRNHNHPRECDPLVNSIMMLQFAQAALEKEISQFGEIGKGIPSFCKDSSENSTIFHGPEVFTDVEMLKTRLGEAEVMLKEKDSKITELVAKSTISPLEDMEVELESLFKQKVEAEIEYVAMTGSNKDLSAVVENHMTLLKEQTRLVKEIEKSSKTAEDVENKAIKLQGQLKEVGALYEEESTHTRRKVVKLTKYLFIQFILLCLAFWPFLSQFSPKSEVVAPT